MKFTDFTHLLAGCGIEVDVAKPLEISLYSSYNAGNICQQSPSNKGQVWNFFI